MKRDGKTPYYVKYSGHIQIDHPGPHEFFVNVAGSPFRDGATGMKERGGQSWSLIIDGQLVREGSYLRLGAESCVPDYQMTCGWHKWTNTFNVTHADRQ